MFLLSDEQRELQRGIREVLAGAWPLDRLTRTPPTRTPSAENAAGDAADVTALQPAWGALGEAGLWDLHGDLGLGWADTVGVFEELGRACLPGPLVATFLLARLPVEGEPGPVALADATAEPILVSDLAVARWLLVLDSEQARLLPADAVTGTRLEPVDPLSSVDAVRDLAAGEPLPVTAGELRLGGALLTAALQVGIAGRVGDLAVDYAKTREQFGRVIGGFQAVKHICADMYARAELARVAVQAAAVTLDDPEVGDVGRAVAGAKLLADEAATANARSAVQVHGGMGFTWEVPVHFFLKRSWRHATEWLTDDAAGDMVAQSL